MAVALQACGKLNPDVFLDTTGYAFTYIVAKLLCSCRVATYTHYPTITTVRGSLQAHAGVVLHLLFPRLHSFCMQRRHTPHPISPVAFFCRCRWNSEEVTCSLLSVPASVCTQDMINRVYERRPTYNNTAAVARSPLFSRLKVMCV